MSVQSGGRRGIKCCKQSSLPSRGEIRLISWREGGRETERGKERERRREREREGKREKGEGKERRKGARGGGLRKKERVRVKDVDDHYHIWCLPEQCPF